MKILPAALVAVVALATAACHTVHSDFDEICHARERAGVTIHDNPAEAAMRVADYMQGHIHTAAARKFLAGMVMLPPDQKVTVLRAEATKAGVSPCPMADELDLH